MRVTFPAFWRKWTVEVMNLEKNVKVKCSTDVEEVREEKNGQASANPCNTFLYYSSLLSRLTQVDSLVFTQEVLRLPVMLQQDRCLYKWC